MSIQSEIERISQAKTDIHSAIESKGVTVPDDTLISEMAPYIQQIREAGTVVTSVSNIGPDEDGNAQLKNLKIYCGEQDITYNGGAEQTLTINPSTVGAATAAQGTLAQTAVQPSQIADFITAEDIPDELPNPYALSIQFNSGTITTYDGSATRNVNITPTAIGAAASSDLEELEPLVGTTSNTTPLQVYNALTDGRQCFITDSNTGITYASWAYNGTPTSGNVYGASLYISNGRIATPSLNGVINRNESMWTRGDTTGLLYTGDVRSSNTQFLTVVSGDGLVLEDISSVIDQKISSSVPITRRIAVTTGWSTSYGDTGTDFKYGRIMSFDGSTTNHEVTGICVAGQNSGSSPTDAQKTAAATWTYVECEEGQLHFYSPTAISTTFYLVVTIQKL